MKGDALLAKQFEDATDKEQIKIDWAKAKYNSVVDKRKTYTVTTDDSWLKNGKVALPPHPSPPPPHHHRHHPHHQHPHPRTRRWYLS